MWFFYMFAILYIICIFLIKINQSYHVLGFKKKSNLIYSFYMSEYCSNKKKIKLKLLCSKYHIYIYLTQKVIYYFSLKIWTSSFVYRIVLSLCVQCLFPFPMEFYFWTLDVLWTDSKWTWYLVMSKKRM